MILHIKWEMHFHTMTRQLCWSFQRASGHGAPGHMMCLEVCNILLCRAVCLVVESCPMFTDFNVVLQQGLTAGSRTFFLTQLLILGRLFGFHSLLHQDFFFVFILIKRKKKNPTTNCSGSLMDALVLTPALRSARSCMVSPGARSNTHFALHGPRLWILDNQP